MLSAYPAKKRKNTQPRRQTMQAPRGMRRKAGALIAAFIIFAVGALFSKIFPDDAPGDNASNGAGNGSLAAQGSSGAGYRVVQVPDGDSLVLKTASGKKERVRLYGVDAPELHQRGGKAAAGFAESLLRSERVSLRVMDKDQYGRIVAVVILKDGRQLNEELVKAGHAWVYRAHCHEDSLCPSWYALERHAKKEGRGLWRDNEPTPPWQWRRQNPRK